MYLTDPRCRTTQKPNEELIQNFKATFPHVAVTTRSHSIANPAGTSLTDALDVAHHNARYVGSQGRSFPRIASVPSWDPSPATGSLSQKHHEIFFAHVCRAGSKCDECVDSIFNFHIAFWLLTSPAAGTSAT